MDEFDETVLQIIATNGGQATTREIIDGLSETKFSNKNKFNLIKRLESLGKFGYIETTEGVSHRGRKPLIHSIRN